MKLPTLFGALLGGLLLSSCVVTAGGSASPSSGFVLAERETADGVETQFRIQSGREDGPAIVRVDTRAVDVAHLGVTTRAIDRAYAGDRGLEAWRGVMITAVSANTGASEAGLRVGNVLVAIDGEVMTNVEQLRELVETEIVAGEPLVVTRLRSDEAGGWIEEDLELVPGTREVSESSTERVALDAPDVLVERTGMQVATVVPELAQDLGLGDEPLALVTGVIPGASAYEEGIRGGDRILRVNGTPCQTADDVVAEMSRGKSTLELEVDGPLGPHKASVSTREDVDERRRFHIPILIDHTQRVDRTRTSFLDFIFQFGFNYRRTSYGSDTREPYETSYLSLLPLGMFEFERSPERRRTRLFWFITFSSRK